jgi:hypothetical protein
MTTTAPTAPSLPVLDRTCRHPDCTSANTLRYMNGWRCKEHSPAAMAGRPEPWVDPTRTLEALQAKAGRPVSERTCRTSSYSATGTKIAVLVWPFDPELQRMAELVDSIMGYKALVCSDCGDPLDGPALIKRCRFRHASATP